MEILSKNLKETQKAAREFAKNISKKQKKGAHVVALYGDLGSGKTSFVQGVARALGVVGTVISPTFVIERRYEISKDEYTHLIHIDAYRLESEGELLALGWKKIVSDPENIIFIEWAERVEGLLPNGGTTIYFEYINETTRKISITN